MAAQLMHEIVIAHLSSQGIQCLLPSLLVLEGSLRKVKLPPVTHLAETLPRHFSHLQTWEQPAGLQGSRQGANMRSLFKRAGYTGEKQPLLWMFQSQSQPTLKHYKETDV